MKLPLASFIITYCLCGLLILCACNAKEKTGSDSTIVADSSKLTKNKITTPTKNTSEQPPKTPLDTILASYPNGKKIQLLVLEYYSINNSKLLKDFELKEIGTDSLVFRSCSSQFYTEKIHNSGELDFITIDPIYDIASRNPLEINLSFYFYGDLSIEYLEGLIGKVTYDTTILDNEQPRMNFNFLTYKLTNDEKLKVISNLQFIPKKCETTNTELSNDFNKFKNNVDIDSGVKLAKLAFICFLNGKNSQYKTIMQEFKKSIPESEVIHDSYPYVEYLDRFIINLNP